MPTPLVTFARRVLNRFRSDAVGMTESIEQILAAQTINDARAAAMVSRIGVAHRIVWGIPQDALSLGWRVDTDEQQDETRDIDTMLGIPEQLLEAWGSARQDGGAWLWVVDGDKQDKPRRPGTPISAVQTVCKVEASVLSWEINKRSPNFGRPLIVQISIARESGVAVTENVHISRLVYIPGAPVTPRTTTDKPGYDLSYLALYAPIIEALEEGYRSNGRLLNRLSMPWIRIKEGATMTASEGGDLDADGDSFADRMTLIKEGIERSALLVLLGEDEAGWAGPSANGVRDLVNIQAERLSSVEGIPLSVLLGQAPSGLSTDDAAGKRTYHKTLERYQNNIISPALQRLYSIILGIEPSRRIVWPDLEKPTELERAQVSQALAARDQLLWSMGAITPDEVRGRYADGEEVADFRFSEAESEIDPIDENGDPLPLESGESGAQEQAPQPGELASPTDAAGLTVAETALNGAQIASLVEVVQLVAARELPRDSAIAIISRSFQVSPEDAADILGSAGESFVIQRTDAVDLKPTLTMAENAARALAWRDEFSRGGTEVGVARARDIANLRNLSPETVYRMRSYFARHEVDKRAEGFSTGEPGFPSAGRIAWDLWGGDAGQIWAERKIAELEREEG